MTADLIQLYADANIRIAKLERDLAWYVREFERLDDRNEVLECENARLQLELDASYNAKELRQVRAENAQLRKTLADTTHL